MPKNKNDLTQLERNFCEEYVKNGGNGTKAMIAARKEPYKKEITASQAASRMYKRVKVQEYITFLQKKATDSTIMSRKEVLRRLTNLGRANMKNLASWSGKSVTLKNSEGLEDHISETVQEVSQKIGKTDELKIKQYDKVKPLELLAKHHGVLDAETEPEDDRPTSDNFEDSVSKSIKKL